MKIGQLDQYLTQAIMSQCDYSNSNYRNWEEKVATPALQAAGYTVLSWNDGERDSFGPLSRYAIVEKDGVRFHLVYG